MTVPRIHHLFLLLLSMAAGCVDAIAFIRVGVFPANMTGNSVVLATSLFTPGSSAMLLSALALLGFCMGAAAGATLVHSPQRGWSRRTDLTIFIAALLILTASVAIAMTGDRWMTLIILATSAAMGMQSAAVQQLGIAGVATVFMTGTLTAAIARGVGAAIDPTTKEFDHWLPALTWLSYFVGAFIGGLHRLLGTNIPLVLPILLLVGVVAMSLRKPVPRT